MLYITVNFCYRIQDELWFVYSLGQEREKKKICMAGTAHTSEGKTRQLGQIVHDLCPLKRLVDFPIFPLAHFTCILLFTFYFLYLFKADILCSIKVDLNSNRMIITF